MSNTKEEWAEHLDEVQSWIAADEATKTAFAREMQGRRYGYEAALDAWLWFAAGRKELPIPPTGAPEIDEWIFIDYDDLNTLPKPGETVLLAHGYGEPLDVSEGWLVETRECAWHLEATDAQNNYLELFGAEVVAWRPMPSPPARPAPAITEPQKETTR